MVTAIKRDAQPEEIRQIKAKLASHKKKGVDLTKYAGKIHLKEDPLEIQKRLRDEWS